MGQAPQKPILRRWHKWSIAAATVFLLYTVTGFFIAPAVIRSQLDAQMSERIGWRASAEKIQMNPYTFEVEILGLAVGPGPETHWLTLDRFHADLQASALLTGKLRLRDVSLQNPAVDVIWTSDGTWNYDPLLSIGGEDTGETSADGGLPGVMIDWISISNAVVRFEDNHLQPGFTARFQEMDLVLTNVHTLGTNRFDFHGVLDPDTSVQAGGQFSLDPVAGHVEANLSNLLLDRFAGYVPDWSPLTVGGGRLDGQAGVAFEIGDGSVQVAVEKGGASVEGLSVLSKDAQTPVFSWNRLHVDTFQARLQERTVSVDAITVEAPALSAVRSKEGSVDWLSWIHELTGRFPASPATHADPSQPWAWSLDRLLVTNAAVQVRDESPAEPVVLGLTNTWLQIKNASQDLTAGLPVGIGFELASGGSGTLTGSVTPTPLQAALDLNIRDIHLLPAEPYVRDLFNFKLKDGKVSVMGRAGAELGATNELRARYQGDIVLNSVAVDEKESGMPFATVGAVEVRGLETDWPIDRLLLQSVKVDSPTAHVYLREDGTANVEEMVPAAITQVIYDQIREVWNLLQFEVDEVTVTNASTHLQDFSVKPPFDLSVSGVHMHVTGIKPRATEPARVEVSGKVADRDPFQVNGEFLPEGTNLTAKVSVVTQGIGVPPGSPYSGKFVGYLIDQGKVSMELVYELDHQTVQGQNRIVIHDFEFGEKAAGEPAVNLPVKLGVSLLKDGDGKIELDVPVQGNLNDPEFNLGNVVWNAVSTVIQKAATAPFRFLGSLVGAGNDEDLSSVLFEPGSTELRDREKRKAEKLSRALSQRPGLRLEIVGSADPSVDAPTLQQRQFDEDLATFKASLPTDTALAKLAEGLGVDETSERADWVRLMYLKEWDIPIAYTTNTPSELLARTILEERTEKALEPQSAAETTRPNFWQRLGSLFRSGPEPVEAETAPDPSQATQGATIFTPDKPTPILPELPSTEAMEQRLVGRRTIPSETLRSIAAARAEAVFRHLAALPEMDENRMAVRETPSEGEPKPAAPAVYLGIF